MRRWRRNCLRESIVQEHVLNGPPLAVALRPGCRPWRVGRQGEVLAESGAGITSTRLEGS